MLVLGIDTSSPAVSVALGKLGADFQMSSSGLSQIASNRHGEMLAPLIDRALAHGQVRASDLDAIAVGLGPGPFTGLRVGVITARAMGDALRIPVYGDCSLDTIGPVDNQRGDERLTFACVSDARRKQVYWAEYDAAGSRVSGPELSAPADLADHLRGRVGLLAGAGAVMYREHFSGFEIEEDLLYPSPGNLLPLIKDRALAGAPSDDLTPLYLRRPDAQPPGRPKSVTPA